MNTNHIEVNNPDNPNDDLWIIHKYNTEHEEKLKQRSRDARYPRKQESKLHRAIRKNDIVGVRTALANGVSPDGGYSMLPSPITRCIRYQRLEIMRLLFEHNVESPQPCTGENGFEDEILIAAGKENLEILKELTKYREEKRGYCGFIPGYFDEAEPIHAAAGWNNHAPGCMNWLLERGANINEETGQWRTPLHFAVDRRQARVEVVRFLLQKGADVDHVTRSGKTAVYLAAKRGNGRVVRELLRASPRLDQKTKQNKETVLHAAAAHCSLAVVKMLVEAGADVYARDQKGLSILEHARKARRTETVEWITQNTTLETLVEELF
ncbi:ankyrin repeat-containing domain protein [Aspergillus egyptiacus]|nr:ankyrin repeat-containing domain protein [Aspergillus egyptiacus]